MSTADDIKRLAYLMSEQDVRATLSHTALRRQELAEARETAVEFEAAVDALQAERDALAAQASRALTGWKLVPLVPTQEMLKAGGHANSEWLNDDAPIGELRYTMPMNSVWEAMLAAVSEPNVEAANKETP